MKIDSSRIGMESARSYASIAARTVNYQSNFAGLGAAKEGKEKSFSDFLGSGEGEEALGETGLSMRNRSYPVGGARSLAGGSSRDRFRDRLSSLMESQMPSREPQFMVVETSMTTAGYFAEAEQTSFSTKGTVVTADGREISFDLGLSMSREFEEYYETTAKTVKTVEMMDPLVINLDTDIASLSDQKFEFDIDGDGILDSISMLQGGSGYLALDKNGDGRINDGTELFGTSSGDGFADLSMYDEDGNGWIDENDEIFSKLLIWSKDENGNDELYHLKDKGVGAICISKVSTNFSLNSLKTNQANGQIRSTGVFLYENGNAGTMQQLDLAI